MDPETDPPAAVGYAAKENAAPARPGLGLKRRPAFNAPTFVKKKLEVVAPGAAARAGGGGAAAASSSQPTEVGGAPPSGEARYFEVLYCKYQPSKKLRKNKSFADGILEAFVESKRAVLLDSDGKQVSTAMLRGVNVATMGAGSNVVIGNWEVEVQEAADAAKFKSGELFLKPSMEAVAATLSAAATGSKQAGRGGGVRPPAGAFKRPGVAGGAAKGADAGAGTSVAPAPRWLHDPTAEGAIVLNAWQWDGGRGRLGGGRPVHPVVVDSYIARHLRPHQVEGVRFLYEAVMGLRGPGQTGAILADDMGLGKTLQVLALLWTLLKQGPEGRPVVRKAVVVTPSSLTQNWAAEARKWLGDERMRVAVLSAGPEGRQQVLDFKLGAVCRVAAVSYETLRKHAADLAGCVDLLVCDEGHRLKAAQGNKTISALTSLNCPRRVLLTGTPLQNNLSEFYAMVSFVNPGCLDSLSKFERVLAAPINRSRDRAATAAERELGEQRSRELSKRVEAFVLRRTREVNAKYLPPLSNYVVFCRPTPLQLRLYSSVLGCPVVKKMLVGSGSDFGDQALTVLTNLRKICNHPTLHTPEASPGSDAGAERGDEAQEFDPAASGKMAALDALLRESLGAAGERVVVVSQSTAALDLVQKLCALRGLSTVRIDGSTDVSKRQDTVNSFNHYGVGQVFLLSTTAGGAGLNLTGANRLVLLDSHWNPAMDLQAMARVWRDGQRKPCVVYRLLTTGTLDEKMYQRQLKKGDLAAATMGGGGGGKAGGKFSKDELKMLFTLRTDTACDTADLLRQAAGGEGAAHAAAAAAAEFVDVTGGCDDAPLRAAIAAGHVTFVHLDRAQQAAAAGAAAAAGGDAQQGGQQCEEGDAEEGGGAAASASGVESLDVEEEDWDVAD